MENNKISLCLVSPCSKELWESLKDRKRMFHKAEISQGKRDIRLILVAVPMESHLDDVVDLLMTAIKD